MFRVGEKIEVYSNSHSKWLDGTVLEAPTRDGISSDGFSVKGGALKIQHEFGMKWIMPELVPSTVRRASTSGTSSASMTAYTAGRPPQVAEGPRCKFNCGRPVQPGLTKGLKSYDTCCKLCANTEGKLGKHDENCGKNFVRAACRRSTLSSEVVLVKERLKQWIDNPQSLGVAISTICSKHGLPSNNFSKDGAATCSKALFRQLGVTLQESVLSRAFTSKNELSSAEFEKVCLDHAKNLYSTHFAPALKLSTADFVQKNPKPLLQVYALGDKLGEGSFGTVYRCTHTISREVRVVKRINKRATDCSYDAILQEIHSMAQLDHPNVIKVYEYFNEVEYVSQIMEPCNGGELQDRIDAVFRHRTQPRYSEAFIRDVMKQTMRALAFMHSKRFAHKDLKPQNIMMVDKQSSSIKVIDFGLAELFNPKQDTASFIGGTLLYMAPEVFHNQLTFKSDVWSAGVVLYNLISGGMPFCGQWPVPPGRDVRWWESETQRKIQHEPMAMNEHLTSVSVACRGTLQNMLEKSMSTRPDAAECIEHEFYKIVDETPTLSVGVVQCLECYSRLPELKKAIFLLMAHQSSAPALEELREIFTYFDIGNEGTLSADDLSKVLTKAGLNPLYVDKVIHTLDRDGDGSVSWTEFTAAALCISSCGKTELVDAAFAHFDADSDDRIDVKDLEFVLANYPGEGRQWAQRLPAMIADFKSPIIKKEQFRSYIGEQLEILSGDSLTAVG